MPTGTHDLRAVRHPGGVVVDFRSALQMLADPIAPWHEPVQAHKRRRLLTLLGRSRFHDAMGQES